MKHLVGLIALFAGMGALSACPNVAPARRAVVVPQAVVVTPAIVTQTVLVPTYTASYSADSAQLLAKLDRIGAAVEKLGQLGGVPAPTSQVNASLQQVFQNRCASCHQGDKTAAVNGGGQVLLEEDGKLSGFSQAELTMIAFYVQGKTPNGHSCPPKSPLPKAEQDFVVEQVTAMHAQQRNAGRAAALKTEDEKLPPPKAAEAK